MRTTRTFSTIAMILAAVILSGCSAFGGSTDETFAVTPTTATASPTTIETLTPATVVTTTVAVPEGRYIDIGPVLDKLDSMGCVVDTLELREVKRGGHASIKCVKKIDALNVTPDNL